MIRLLAWSLPLLLLLALPARADDELAERFARYRSREHALGLRALELRRGQEQLIKAKQALHAYRGGLADPRRLSDEERERIDALEADYLSAREAYGQLLQGEAGEAYRRLKGAVEGELKALARALGEALAAQDDLRLRRMRAHLLVDKGRFDLAERDLEPVLAGAPQDGVALTLRGRCREATGRTEAALDDYRAALAAQPSDERRLRAAVACYWLNRFVEARELRDAVADPSKLPAQLQLDHGWYLARPKLVEAEKRWQRELTLRHQDEQQGGLPRVRLQTTRGEVVLELFARQAPKTAATFLELVRQGFYDQLAWHRVQPLRLAVTGKPTQPVQGDAAGPGFATPPELGEQSRHHFRGSVGWLPRGPRGRGGSQLYLLLRPDPELDGRSLVIGRIVSGVEHAAQLKEGDLVQKAEVVREPGFELPAPQKDPL